ncbi:YsnF/AvaK domain-containing protein [Paracoccus sp. MC1854]|uniref:YsnF/AvaK domain-containing protein n=1 Tax=Paracoccus sp. MC1854 TaxID=2760306 RepID=UPI0016018DCB|nr:YsnF/AvaK domain-containing protein [Paracoccus sp. MC1854]MBB1492738.1 YsnF/AvaK domain-containing protein [Paracoccus sp. MC1854]
MSKQSRPARDAVSARPAQIIPIVEEQVLVLKRKTLTEGVRVRTVVREDEALIDEPVVRETVEVERVPLGRWVDGPVPVRQEGDITIVTLVEEVVVVEKRLRATEEIRITRRRDAGQHSETVTLRHEEAVIEHLNANGDSHDPD